MNTPQTYQKRLKTLFIQNLFKIIFVFVTFLVAIIIFPKKTATGTYFIVRGWRGSLQWREWESLEVLTPQPQDHTSLKSLSNTLKTQND